MSLGTACYLVHYKPFTDPLVQQLDVFNELTTDTLFSLVYCFTGLTKVKTHLTIAYFFMGVICINVTTHLYFLLKGIA